MVTAAAMVFVLLLAGVWPAESAHVHSRAPSPALAAARLQSLPLAAQSIISSTVGSNRAVFAARPDGAGYRLAGGGVKANLMARGAVLSSRAGSVSMVLAGVGRGTRLGASAPSSLKAHANRVSYAGSGLQQSYTAGPLGVEQGFTLATRPAGGRGPLTVALRLGGSLRPQLTGSQVLFRTSGGRVAMRYGALSAVDASGRRLPAALALKGHSLLLHVDDRGARYPLRIDPLVQQGEKLTGEGEEGQAAFGFSVALSADGKTAIVGAPNDQAMRTNPEHGWGAAWVFTRTGTGTWTQQKLITNLETEEEELGAEFGFSVALSADGKTAVVGAPYENAAFHHTPKEKGYGAVWVFTGTQAGTWGQQGPKLTGPPEETGKGSFGFSVALSESGDTALIGGWTDHGFKGAAWVYTRSNGAWSPQGPKLTGGEEVSSGQEGAGEGSFGFAVALSYDGNTALIGGPGDSGFRGAGWVFTRSGTTWSQQQKVTASDETGESNLGFSVALSADGNTALMGGPFDSSAGPSAGAAWVFTRSGSTWAQQGNKLTGTCEESAGHFGESVALSPEGNVALIGGPLELADAGAAWVFTRSQAGAWTQQGQELTGGGEAGAGRFGESIWLSSEGNAEGTTALIGGFADNGTQGAAWVFMGSPAGTPTTSCPIITSTTHTSTQTSSAPASTTTSTTTAVTPARPSLERVAQSHSRWREGSALASISKLRRGRGSRGKDQPPIGTTFSFALNEQASVSFAFTQRVAGRKVKGKCVAPTRINRRRHACMRTVTQGTLSFNGHVGENKVAFQGRISPSKKLRPGRYTLVVTATNSAGQRSTPARLSFTIVK